MKCQTSNIPKQIIKNSFTNLGSLSTSNLIKLTSFLFWNSLYLWCTVCGPKEKPEWCSRVITLLHGTVATVVGLSQCSIRSFSECYWTSKIGPQHFALMAWSWGYFAFDLLWCLIYWTDSILMLCHHASALVAITLFMQKEYRGSTYACSVAMMEITNPFLQTRWFLKNDGYGQTTLFYVVEVLYLVMFISIRGIFGTYLVFRILTSNLFEMDEKVISFVFYLVSMGLIYQILGYIIYKYKSQIVEFKEILDKLDYILNEQ